MTPTPSNRFARLSHRHLPLLLTLLCALVLAGCLLPTLETRPMHHDEANQAYSARRLLDFHGYRFRPEDHHGPTLYYALLPVAWLRGVFSGAELDLATVRLVPLAFACLTLLLPLLAGNRLGRGAPLLAAVALALSPCFAYYSTYFVQEMLLTAFLALTLLSLWRWLDGGGRPWAIACGAAFGLCVATKETWVLSAAAAVLAGAATALAHRREALALWRSRRADWRDLGAAALAALLVAGVLFSSFGANPHGIPDFFRCWLHYAHKGTTTETPFAAPFPTYLRWLFWFRASGTPSAPLFSEWLILAGYLLAVLLLALPRLRPRGLRPAPLLFLVLHAPILLLLYSCIPYKTPWCCLSILHAFALPAGAGLAALVFSPCADLARLAAAAVAVAAALRLPDCRNALTRLATDPRNPWAYAHTQRDYLRLPARLRKFPQAVGRAPYTLVLTDYIDHWPLPWYTYETDHIDYMDFRGWGADPDKDKRIRRKLDAEPDFILCRLDDITAIPHHERYHWEDITLRPNVILRLATHRDVLPALLR